MCLMGCAARRTTATSTSREPRSGAVPAHRPAPWPRIAAARGSRHLGGAPSEAPCFTGNIATDGHLEPRSRRRCSEAGGCSRDSPVRLPMTSASAAAREPLALRLDARPIVAPHPVRPSARFGGKTAHEAQARPSATSRPRPHAGRVPGLASGAPSPGRDSTRDGYVTASAATSSPGYSSSCAASRPW
jgi:hypothetical protein